MDVTTEAPAAPPAGWYADPQNAAHQRYWNGAAWTEHVQPAAPGETAADELHKLRLLETEREADRKQRRRNIRALVLGLIAALLLLWTSGRMDPALSHVGLNYNDCVKNGFGATFCGDDAKNYQTNVNQAQRQLDDSLKQLDSSTSYDDGSGY